MTTACTTVPRTISHQVFAKNLFETSTVFYNLSRGRSQSRDGPAMPLRVGVAVSGGPDSMLLAYFLKHATRPNTPEIPAFEPHGMIVDHAARPGSREEALRVQQYLASFGLSSTVMTIAWPTGTDPATMKGFEDAARRERYQLLLREAAKTGCAAIFTGHHQDDQVETLLMRMIRNQNLNLAGCRGIQDVSLQSSVGRVMGADLLGQERMPANISSASPIAKGVATRQCRFDEVLIPGIKSCRLLLPFTKAQILDTCASFGIPYVLDKTNYDPTHTLRNAIRHLRQQALPRALQAPRLLAMREHANAYHVRAETVLASFKALISRLHVHGRLGLVDTILQPSFADEEVPFRLFVARLIDFVSPSTNNTSLELYANPGTAERLQRHTSRATEAMQHNNASRDNPMRKNRHSAEALSQFSKLSPMRVNEHKVTIEACGYEQAVATDGIRIVFSRQNPSMAEKNIAIERFEVKPQLGPSAEEGFRLSSDWLLWDGRFWIQIQSTSIEAIREVEMRFLTEADSERLSKARKLDQMKSTLRALDLPRHISANLLYTIPVLALHGDVFAFPTLDLSIDETVPVSWKVKYHRNERAVEAFSKMFPESFKIAHYH